MSRHVDISEKQQVGVTDAPMEIQAKIALGTIITEYSEESDLLKK